MLKGSVLYRSILKLLKKPEENRFAIEEICYAITKADGYFYDSVAEQLELFGMAAFMEYD